MHRREFLQTLAASAAALKLHPELWASNASVESDPSLPAPSGLCLYYRQPAKFWTQALPVGNGRLGAMVYGGTDVEQIQLNEETVWTGSPYDPTIDTAREALPEIRRLVFEGEYLKAYRMFGRTMFGIGIQQEMYQPLGNLWLTFPGHEAVTNYQRQLNLDEAIVRVTYNIGDVLYTREVFSSPVDQVLVVHITADKPKKVSFSALMAGSRATEGECDGDDYYLYDGVPPDELVVHGKAASHLGIPGKIKYQSRAKAIVEGGKLTVQDMDLTVEDADSVTLLIAAATNYVSYNDLSGDPEPRVKAWLATAAGKSYEELRNAHLAEHRRLFRRVHLDLGTTEAAKLPTDERIRKFRQQDDPQLVTLLFQYGRYLLLSSSRPGCLPANLQGIWNDRTNPAWESKYTTNINLEMNYWQAEVANLSECAEPLFKMIADLVAPGTHVAQVDYGVGGWVLHQNTDIWLAAAPMDGPTWGTFATGGAWLCTHLWEHYLFNGNKEDLRRFYPLMKGSAQFFLETLVEHPQKKWLVTCPSMSPETFPHRPGNAPFLDEVTNLRQPGTSICAGPAVDMEILRSLFEGCIQASEILGMDTDFRQRLRETRQRLAPLQIGKYGQLQEWLEDWDDPNDHNRHCSHLWAVYPGHEITPLHTPQLAAAATKSLQFRGDGGTGWSMAWKVGLWARLLNGDHSYKLIENQLTMVESEDADRRGGTYPNLTNACPPFQIDGSLGVTAGIAEMLVQSHAGEIHLLPALPTRWKNGSVEGLRARGGFEVSVAWKNGKLQMVTIHSTLDGPCSVRTLDPVVVTKDGSPIPLSHPAKNVIRFQAEQGSGYHLEAQ